MLRRRQSPAARAAAAELAAIRLQVPTLPRLSCEDVDRLLGRVYRIDTDGAGVVLRVSSFDDRGQCVLRVLNAVPRRQVVPAVLVLQAVHAGAMVEL